MNLAEQMQANIKLQKALPKIQRQLTYKSTAEIEYDDNLAQLLRQEGFDAEYCQREGTMFVRFKDRGGFWSNR